VSAASGEPEVIHDVREAFKTGRTYLYTQVGDMVCAIADLLTAYDTLAQQRDEAVRERDEARVFANRWMKAAVYATPVTTLAFDPMNPEAFAESRRHFVDVAMTEADTLRARLEACEHDASNLEEAMNMWRDKYREAENAKTAAVQYIAAVDCVDDAKAEREAAQTVRGVPNKGDIIEAAHRALSLAVDLRDAALSSLRAAVAAEKAQGEGR
jgi:hypothetical protein